MSIGQILLMLTCLSSATSSGQVDSSATKLSRILVRDAMQSQKLVGMAVAVSRGDTLLWSEGFGYADLENEVKISPSSSLFRIGSISKTLTAAGLALLYEDHKLDLDASIEFYYPAFPLRDNQITVRQVGGHLAGIRHYRGDEFLNTKRYTSVAESMEIFVKDSLLSKPGEKYSYSSYGWNLLSFVAEEISQTPFLSFMHQRVFSPLAMSRTQPDFPERITPGRVRFYQLADGETVNCPFVDNSYKWAGGGFLSTAEDLIRFGQAHLENRLVHIETWSVFTTAQRTNAGESTGYGIGWRSATDRFGHHWVGHSGGSVGGISMLQVFPAEKLIVVILTNMSQANIGNLTSEIANAFMQTQ